MKRDTNLPILNGEAQLTRIQPDLYLYIHCVVQNFDMRVNCAHILPSFIPLHRAWQPLRERSSPFQNSREALDKTSTLLFVIWSITPPPPNLYFFRPKFTEEEVSCFNIQKKRFSKLSSQPDRYEKTWRKNSGLNGIRTHNLCDAGAVLYQLCYQANWELVMLWIRNKPVKNIWINITLGVAWGYNHQFCTFVIILSYFLTHFHQNHNFLH